MYLLIKYIKSVLWRAAKRLSYIGDARCLKVNADTPSKYSLLSKILFLSVPVQYIRTPGYHLAGSRYFLPTQPIGPSFKVQVSFYHYLQRNNPEERSYQLLRDGSQK